MHTIRLRGPWQVEPVWRYERQADGSYLPNSEDLPPAAREKMPADWSTAFGKDFIGRVAYRRVFHRPTGLDGGERVFLVVEPARSEACVTIKGKLVGFVDPGDLAMRFEITDRLEDDNELAIFVDHPAMELIDDHPVHKAMRSTVDEQSHLLPGGLVGEVRLEIEE